MLKKCKVFMLPSNEKATDKNICLNTSYAPGLTMPLVKGFNEVKGTSNKHLQVQHLYFTSDDEIEMGDWCYSEKHKNIDRVTSNPVNVNNSNGYYKVLATNDSSLWEHDDTVPYPKRRPALPQPSQQFIEKYVEEYNKGQQISDILVEYEEY